MEKDLKEYEISITAEITYTITLPAKNEKDAKDTAWKYAPCGPCKITFDDYNDFDNTSGYIHSIYARSDIVVENPDDADEEEE